MPRTHCPECDGRVLVPNSARAGDFLYCPECGQRLEILSLNPLELEIGGYGLGWPTDEDLLDEEDWDWEEDWEEK